jgi:hypothetical protein
MCIKKLNLNWTSTNIKYEMRSEDMIENLFLAILIKFQICYLEVIENAVLIAMIGMLDAYW